MEHRTPNDVWSGKEVKLSHLKVFSCVAYVHISDQGKNKLDLKSEKCTFIGYGEDEFGYHIWDDKNKNVIHSRDMIFDKRVMYKNMYKIDSNDSVQSKSVFADVNTDNVLDSPVMEPIVVSPQLEEIIGQSSAQ